MTKPVGQAAVVTWTGIAIAVLDTVPPIVFRVQRTSLPRFEQLQSLESAAAAGTTPEGRMVLTSRSPAEKSAPNAGLMASFKLEFEPTLRGSDWMAAVTQARTSD